MWWLRWLNPLSRECGIFGRLEQIFCGHPELGFVGHTSGPYLLPCLVGEWAGLQETFWCLVRLSTLSWGLYTNPFEKQVSIALHIFCQTLPLGSSISDLSSPSSTPPPPPDHSLWWQPLWKSWPIYLLVGCLTSQQHASVSQGRICSDNCTCCHTETEVAHQTFYLTQSVYWHWADQSQRWPYNARRLAGSHWSANF